jgi:hypothetical protein
MTPLGWYVEVAAKTDVPGKYAWSDVTLPDGRTFIHENLGVAMLHAREHMRAHPETDGWVRVSGRGHRLFPEVNRKTQVRLHGKTVAL